MCKHCIAGGSNEVCDQETMLSELATGGQQEKLQDIKNCSIFLIVLNILEARGEVTKKIIIYIILSLYLRTTHFACQFIKKLFLNFLFQHEKIVANGITHAIDYRTTNYAQEVKK